MCFTFSLLTFNAIPSRMLFIRAPRTSGTGGESGALVAIGGGGGAAGAGGGGGGGGGAGTDDGC